MLSYSLWSMHLDVLAGPGWQLVSHRKISQLIHLRTRASVVATCVSSALTHIRACVGFPVRACAHGWRLCPGTGTVASRESDIGCDAHAEMETAESICAIVTPDYKISPICWQCNHLRGAETVSWGRAF